MKIVCDQSLDTFLSKIKIEHALHFCALSQHAQTPLDHSSVLDSYKKLSEKWFRYLDRCMSRMSFIPGGGNFALQTEEIFAFLIFQFKIYR
jgi:hypothetical protein